MRIILFAGFLACVVIDGGIAGVPCTWTVTDCEVLVGLLMDLVTVCVIELGAAVAATGTGGCSRMAAVPTGATPPLLEMPPLMTLAAFAGARREACIGLAEVVLATLLAATGTGDIAEFGADRTLDIATGAACTN
jgi:hypothetical protein